MHVTITGADDGVDIRDLVKLSREFPFVEWGILFSQSHQGEHRYPSEAWLMELCRRGHRLKLAMHLCGKMARDLLAGSDQWLDGWSIFERVQVNGYTPPSAGLVAVAQHEEFEFVLQVRAEDQVQEAARDAERMPRASILFDPSGGRGIETFKWPVAPNGCRMGYAGGIGPANVEQVLRDIGPVTDSAWVDMESGVRDEQDRFDLGKVRDVLEKVRGGRSAVREAEGGEECVTCA